MKCFAHKMEIENKQINNVNSLPTFLLPTLLTLSLRTLELKDCKLNPIWIKLKLLKVVFYYDNFIERQGVGPYRIKLRLSIYLKNLHYCIIHILDKVIKSFNFELSILMF